MLIKNKPMNGGQESIGSYEEKWECIDSQRVVTFSSEEGSMLKLLPISNR